MSDTSAELARITFFMPSLAGGGAERVTLDLAASLAAQGSEVRLILAHGDGALAGDVRLGAPGVTTIDLDRRRTLMALPALVRELRRSRPDVLVAVLAHAGVLAAFAHLLARSSVRLVIMHHNTMSLNVQHSPRWRDRLVPWVCARAFRRADTICAVSEGVADDLARTTGIPRKRITVFPNPIDYGRIRGLANEEIPEDLRTHPGDRLMVAAGRLVPQKDFATLLRALSIMGAPHNKLVILGEGPERRALEDLAQSLGIEGQVAFPGHLANPYPLFRAADVFVLSSRWEGLPTVLLEVMGFDTPIVSTDCPSGPQEILGCGAHGALVPVGDHHALAQAITRSFEIPRDPRRADVRGHYDRDHVAIRFRSLVTVGPRL